MSELRLASLVPSLTELVVDLGLGERLVARTGYCVHPAALLRTVPKVGGTKDVNLVKLRRLRPTHVLVNLDENRRETVDAMGSWPEPPRVIITHPMGPLDNLALIEQFVQEFDSQVPIRARAQALSHALRDELELTRPDARQPVRVLYLIWREPWMTVARDTYISAMLAQVGWLTLPDLTAGRLGAARYPLVRGDEAWLAQVDRVLLSSEPYKFGPQHVDAALEMCPNASAALVDGELLSWYGSRAVQGLRYLRQLAGATTGHN